MRLLFKRKINLLLLWLFVFPRPKDRFCRVVTREKVCLFSFTKAELRQQKFESKRSLCCHEVEKAFAFFFFCLPRRNTDVWRGKRNANAFTKMCVLCTRATPLREPLVSSLFSPFSHFFFLNAVAHNSVSEWHALPTFAYACVSHSSGTARTRGSFFFRRLSSSLQPLLFSIACTAIEVDS